MSRSKKPRKAYRPRPITADTMALATHFAAKPSVGRIIMTTKRGLTHQEAMEYVGVKRRTFDEVWRPQLVAMRQGACLVFDLSLIHI